MMFAAEVMKLDRRVAARPILAEDQLVDVPADVRILHPRAGRALSRRATSEDRPAQQRNGRTELNSTFSPRMKNAIK